MGNDQRVRRNANKKLTEEMPFLIFVLSIVSKAAWNKMSEIFFLIQPNIRIRGHA